jgi:3-hydroxy-3-methylglutaryl CoA synthase
MRRAPSPEKMPARGSQSVYFMDYGITSVGAYIPRYRLARASIAAAHRWMAPSLAGAAKGYRAFCAWDEDAVTMAVEAGRDCLRGADAKAITSLVVASTTLPYADLQNSTIVASALALPEVLSTADATGSARAATTALISMFETARDGAMLIASERPRAKPASTQEMSYGAGAAAVALGHEGVIARPLGHASISAYFIDHFRASDVDHDYFWEERWIRDEGYAKIVPGVVKSALAKAGVGMSDINHLVMASPIRGAAQPVAKSIGFAGKIADALDAECGYAGAAHGLLMLARVLEDAKAGERILLIGFGQGADALILEATGKSPASPGWRGVSASLVDKYPTEDYLRMLSFQGEIGLEWGMRSEKTGKVALTEAYRSSRQLASFQAGECRACGTVQFPQLAYCVNDACKAPASQFDQVSLRDAPAKILTYTADWLSYHPAPPLFVGFVQFENGARLLMETVDAPSSAVDVGVPLRMVFRIKERDNIRGFNRYFWKATPIQL